MDMIFKRPRKRPGSGSRGQVRSAANCLLPVEILQEIFEIIKMTWLSRWEKGWRNAPTVLSHVCRLWRNVALNTPSIWSTIQITDFTHPVKVFSYANRSGKGPLRVYFCLSKPREDLDLVVLNNFHRLVCLCFEAYGEGVVRHGLDLVASAPEMPNLCLLRVGDHKLHGDRESEAPPTLPDKLTDDVNFAPALGHLSLKNIGTPSWKNWRNLSGLHTLSLDTLPEGGRLNFFRLQVILLHSPELEILRISDKSFIPATLDPEFLGSAPWKHRACLPNLAQLSIKLTTPSSDRSGSPWIHTFFTYASAPNLKHFMLQNITSGHTYTTIAALVRDGVGLDWQNGPLEHLTLSRCKASSGLRHLFCLLRRTKKLTIIPDIRTTKRPHRYADTLRTAGVTDPDLVPLRNLQELGGHWLPTGVIKAVLKDRESTGRGLHTFRCSALPFWGLQWGLARICGRYGVTLEEMRSGE